jgi:hypothetical protein
MVRYPCPYTEFTADRRPMATERVDFMFTAD